jgi:phosphohistidine phosphatase
MKALGVQPGLVASSPLVRALETAEILRDVLLPGRRVEVCDFLAPGATADELLFWLSESDCADVMVVGHNPDCPDIAAALLAMGDTATLSFGKAAACCISFEAGPALGDGRLEWLLQPKQLRMLE